MSDPRSQWYGQMRHESVPADHLFGRRLETLTLAVLSQLRRERNNWHRIAREWVYGDAARRPSSAARRPSSTAAAATPDRVTLGLRAAGSARATSCPAGRSAGRR